eukprot:3982328-Amphidinium_carterae.1
MTCESLKATQDTLGSPRLLLTSIPEMGNSKLSRKVVSQMLKHMQHEHDDDDDDDDDDTYLVKECLIVLIECTV